MWSPTHIQVTVLAAKGLLTKGKNGTNNCFVTIALGKEKFQTSIKDKSQKDVDWREECELTIPDHGNRAELVLTCLHRNNLGMDEFLGQVTLPLYEMDAYERPRSRWYKLNSKPGKEKKDKDRGELEVRVAFTVKAGSLTDLSKKEKNKSSTLGLGGSLLSLGTLEKRKSLKKFAKSLGSKVHISGKSKKDKSNDNDSVSGSVSSLSTPGSGQFQDRRYGGGQALGDADPGVISEDDDEFAFDNLSNKSSASSINMKSRNNLEPNKPQMPPPPSPLAIHSNPSHSASFNTVVNNTTTTNDEDIKLRMTPSSSSSSVPPAKPARHHINDAPEVDEWEAKLYGGKHLETSSDSLKRLSWDARVPLNKHDADDVTIKSTTAPNTPDLEQQKNQFRGEQTSANKPLPLPRSGTMENITESQFESLTSTKKTVSTPIAVEKEKKEKSEKRFSNKLKYFRKDKNDTPDDNGRSNKTVAANQQHRQFGERIIIGHENQLMMNAHRKQVEVPQDLMRKYEGKSREEIMLLANDLEHEVKIQKIKMKEMEDYLDDLLLRVMETQPKLLQNPYRTQNSAKSG